jgi:hypothetical protein
MDKKYKQPAFWILALGVVTIIIGAALVSNPIRKKVNTKSVISKNEQLQEGSKSGVSNFKYVSFEALKKSSSLVEDNLNIILSSPHTSSNPEDYISTHRTEYENILKGGEDAANYMLLQFRNGSVKNDLRGQIIMRLCKDLLGKRNNVQDKNLLPIQWYSKLQIVEKNVIPYFSYDGTDSIEKLVYKTEIEKNQNIRNDLTFLIVAPHIHGTYEEGNKLKVFVTTFASTYQFYEKTLYEQCGSISPSAITYVKNADGSYKLDKYEQSEDGDTCGPSIKKFCTMPVSGKKIRGLSDKILKYESDNKDIIKLQRDNLIKHLKVNGQTGISIKEVTGKIVPLT